MDLSFHRQIAPSPEHRAAMLLASAATRQADSPTARAAKDDERATDAGRLLASESGAFNAAVAATLTRWQGM